MDIFIYSFLSLQDFKLEICDFLICGTQFLSGPRNAAYLRAESNYA
jgi:hypothetical protein